MNTNDPLYIGWQERAPARLRARMRRTVLVLLFLTIILAVVLARAQRLVGASFFEWGTVKSFAGLLVADPYPRLLVPRPGQSGTGACSSYYLVAPFKFGLPPGLADRFNGKAVTLQGTLVYRENQTMIEVRPGTMAAAAQAGPPGLCGARTVSLGRHTLVGEIVDSKCYLGVMNPGQLTTHRACAIRCLSGGVPPVLLVRPANGPAQYFLLVSADGRQVNREVLSLVAEPVRITGEVVRQGELLVLRADPKTYRRLSG